MRKTVPVFESTADVSEAASPVVKKCTTLEKMLKELGNYSKKITAIKNDEKDGFSDNADKLGELDEIALDLENLINRISKL